MFRILPQVIVSGSTEVPNNEVVNDLVNEVKVNEKPNATKGKKAKKNC
jgi:hypothetical protein